MREEKAVLVVALFSHLGSGEIREGRSDGGAQRRKEKMEQRDRIRVERLFMHPLINSDRSHGRVCQSKINSPVGAFIHLINVC